ncbi:type II toxin-antitoxin system VapC family toxin [Patulibacter minatonensis]|uniref:type II toxin-antitoxin system VapC family toxin n=1 Tax=Patulibacter minatonensis TaxID=298163 RepID=UPI00047E2F9E|nr:type II toxin-antitoxin system VapC family toxin [Patulibacter minatonensis]
MGVAYVDTSALGRVLLGEPDAPAILSALADHDRHVSSRLLRVELRRVALREDRLANADSLLNGVALVPVSAEILADAETIAPATVATLDAIHLATAQRLRALGQLDVVVTYDRQLARGAKHHGIPVLAPV